MTTVGFADRTALITPGDNRPGDKLSRFAAFVIHETANEAAGATAEMHRRYWDVGGGGRTVSSVHFVVDSTESIQLIPTDEQAWHAGDVVGNTTGVGLEICVNSRGGYGIACRKAATIAAKVLKANNTAPVDGISLRKHGSYPGTTHRNCPQHLNAGDWGVSWGQFVDMVKQEYAALATVNYVQLWGTSFAYFEASGIAQEWRRAATVLGAATSDETKDAEGRIWRLFMGGAISFSPTTGECTSYFARAK